MPSRSALLPFAFDRRHAGNQAHGLFVWRQRAKPKLQVPNLVMGDDILASPAHELGYAHLARTNPFDSSNPGHRVLRRTVVNNVLYKLHRALPFNRPNNCHYAPVDAVLVSICHESVTRILVSRVKVALVTPRFVPQGIPLANIPVLARRRRRRFPCPPCNGGVVVVPIPDPPAGLSSRSYCRMDAARVELLAPRAAFSFSIPSMRRRWAACGGPAAPGDVRTRS